MKTLKRIIAILAIAVGTLDASPRTIHGRAKNDTVFYVPITTAGSCVVNPAWLQQGCSDQSITAWLEVIISNNVTSFLIIWL